MKSLNEYINESINSKYLSKLNLKGLPNSDNPDYTIGKNQEKFIINKLNEAYPEYTWVSIKDYYKDSYDTKKDLIDGDIVGLKDDKPKFFIDAKVSQNSNKKYYGVISLNSILNFENENHYYLCVNSDGSDFIVKTSSEIKTLFDKTNKCLKVTNNNKRKDFIKKDLDKYIDKYIDNTEDVSLKDYMPSYIFSK